MELDSWIVAGGKLAAFFASYAGGLYAGVLLHELGHALAALAATRQPVTVRVGVGGGAWRLRAGRLRLELGWRRFRFGTTGYDRAAESRLAQTAVALAGPAASFAVAALCVWGMRQFYLGEWGWVAAFGAFLANLRVLVSSLWPAPYRPDPDGEEEWLSDALDVWRLWRG